MTIRLTPIRFTLTRELMTKVAPRDGAFREALMKLWGKDAATLVLGPDPNAEWPDPMKGGHRRTLFPEES